MAEVRDALEELDDTSEVHDNPESDVIPLTRESADIMIQHLRIQFNYIPPVWRDNMQDYHDMNIEINPRTEYAAMEIDHRWGIDLVKTWKEWDMYLEDVVTPWFNPKPYWVLEMEAQRLQFESMRLAFYQSMHPRLGRESPMHSLEPETMAYIWDLVSRK